MGADLAWWLAWTSNPVGRSDPALGGFDSHTFPPYLITKQPMIGCFFVSFFEIFKHFF